MDGLKFHEFPDACIEREPRTNRNPVGGLCFLAGWACMAYAAWKG